MSYMYMSSTANVAKFLALLPRTLRLWLM